MRGDRGNIWRGGGYEVGGVSVKSIKNHMPFKYRVFSFRSHKNLLESIFLYGISFTVSLRKRLPPK